MTIAAVHSSASVYQTASVETTGRNLQAKPIAQAFSWMGLAAQNPTLNFLPFCLHTSIHIYICDCTAKPPPPTSKTSRRLIRVRAHGGARQRRFTLP